MTAKLVLYQQDIKIQDYVLVTGSYIIGRSDRADIWLNDRWVSRKHCQLDLQEGAIRVRDLGSTHGTFVNDKPVVEANLSQGDTLRIGLSRLVADFCDSSCSDSNLATAQPARAAVRS
jgi:pSer/pThr/pTyr-binding forkhead associated (FHA) protein